MKSAFLVIIASVLFVGCSSTDGVPKLTPELAALETRLAAHDHLDPNIRGSEIYREVQADYIDISLSPVHADHNFAQMTRMKEDLQDLSAEGNLMAMVILGFHYKYERDYSATKAAFSAACEAGNMLGCVNLGVLYEGMGGFDRSDPWNSVDDASAHESFTIACDGGSAIGCRLLARQYKYGKVGPKDYATAFKLLTRSCEIGNDYGCLDLGVFYDSGIEVAEDNHQARELFDQACLNGHEGGCLRLKRVIREIEQDASR